MLHSSTGSKVNVHLQGKHGDAGLGWYPALPLPPNLYKTRPPAEVPDNTLQILSSCPSDCLLS